MKKLFLTAAVAASLIVPAAASASSHAPNVRCRPLDTAERVLDRKGFRTVERGGGVFGIVVKSAWVVVGQSQRGHTVVLYAGRSC